jgi:hypothetical protein
MLWLFKKVRMTYNLELEGVVRYGSSPYLKFSAILTTKSLYQRWSFDEIKKKLSASGQRKTKQPTVTWTCSWAATVYTCFWAATAYGLRAFGHLCLGPALLRTAYQHPGLHVHATHKGHEVGRERGCSLYRTAPLVGWDVGPRVRNFRRKTTLPLLTSSFILNIWN